MASKKEAWKSELYGDAVRDKIEEFAEKGVDAIPEEERDKWFTRFKFWGVFQQRTGQNSYFMMRLTNANGVLEPGQLRAIGEVARDYASGPVENPEFGDAWIDLTTRQSIQLHWLELEDIPEVWERLEAAGVSSRSAGGDTMRNITGCPVAGRDKHELVESQPLLDRFQEDLRGNDALSNMPRKFNISVTGCREGCAQDSINDVGLEPATKEIDGETVTGFNVRRGRRGDRRRGRTRTRIVPRDARGASVGARRRRSAVRGRPRRTRRGRRPARRTTRGALRGPRVARGDGDRTEERARAPRRGRAPPRRGKVPRVRTAGRGVAPRRRHQ